MTLPDSTPRQQFTGNGVATAFAFPYLFFDEADVKVFRLVISTEVESLVAPSEYTVTGEGNPLGGTVTFATEPTTDHRLTILRQVSFIQDSDYVSNEGFPADAHEKAVDRLVMMCQELREVQARTLKVPKSVSDALAIDPELPLPQPLESITWDAEGDGLDSVANSAAAVIGAEAAQAAAENARNQAQTAQTAAELAETNAETAQTAAETAKTAAEAAQATIEAELNQLPDLAGNGKEYVRVNSGETAFEATPETIIENRTSDPSSPSNGEMWFRTDQ